MKITDNAKKNHDELFEGIPATKVNGLPLTETDQDYLEFFLNFAFDEVWENSKLDKKTRLLLIMTSMIAQNTRNRYLVFLKAALKNGVAPSEIKEMIYQCLPYCGMPRVFDYIIDTNQVLTELGIKIPSESRTTTSRETRFDEGLKTQIAIFGDTINQMKKNAPKGQEHIQDYLSANCFGDYYTRKGLDLKTRELITFTIILSLGGCEPQLKGHISGNNNIGNDKELLVDVTTQLLPYVGYPRTLNALRCINEVLKD